MINQGFILRRLRMGFIMVETPTHMIISSCKAMMILFKKWDKMTHRSRTLLFIKSWADCGILFFWTVEPPPLTYHYQYPPYVKFQDPSRNQNRTGHFILHMRIGYVTCYACMVISGSNYTCCNSSRFGLCLCNIISFIMIYIYIHCT